ncbi:alpha/beta hydrolase [Paenibacillus sediminis]|uniref:Pimeloyl-ACP methyl ester carboxylesterase n=1 Tax=Paenibacillus sediminis TaxID=664909 RepID=A0ABS4H206_9BACL|nr:alpha/beta hydrolase [Paenibacillus sediminis]MBP1936559.1 pimeloyl-ACP methyl ester carboxylesterase [Paenibacillus sediminis]
MKKIQVGDGQIYYEKAGSGKAIVFIHGMGLDARMWDQQFEEFCKSYTVIRYDVRGYGRSSIPDTKSYTHQGDLKALLDFLEITDVCLVGLSMGGGIVINFALDFPEYVDAIVLSNSYLEGYISKELNTNLENIYKELKLLLKDNNLEKARELWLTSPYFTHAINQESLREKLIEMLSTYTFWNFANHNPIISPKVKARNRLGELKIKCMVLTSEFDLPNFIEMANILSSEIEGCQLFKIPNIGHMSNMENPRTFNKLLHDFVRNL